MRDWVAWHEAYDDPSSYLSARLRTVQAYLSDAIDQAPPGPVRLVSLCAGQGRDVLGVLPGHPRRDEVRAVLVEADADNVGLARARAAEAGLSGVEARNADASRVASFADALPADVLLLCGIFGNISDQDVERTIGVASELCAPGATVIWTRNRRPPDRTPWIRGLFQQTGFEEVAFKHVQTTDRMMSVGVNRLPGRDRPVGPGGPLPAEPLFTFRPKN